MPLETSEEILLLSVLAYIPSTSRIRRKPERLQWLGRMKRTAKKRTVREIAWKKPGNGKKEEDREKDGERLC